MITVFTPAYNRAHLLQRLYESLEAQTCKDFEWVVVDDGSQDNTKEVIEEYIKSSSFPIRYFYQENGGKHRAINRGVKEAKGELFFIVDSDDSITENAIETITDQYKEVCDDNSFCGVSGCMTSHSGNEINNLNQTLSFDGITVHCIYCNALDIRYKYNVKGDLAEVFKTAVLREFPFPEIDNERFCPEALVWNRIAQKYKLRYFDEVIYHRDYLDGGLTEKIVKIRMDSPIASTAHYAELNSYNIPFLQKVKAAINYWRFWLCLSDKSKAVKISNLWVLAFPLGLLMHLKDS